jgi:hypothetical protein
MDPGLTEIDLSNFTGKSPDHYADQFVYEALMQAGDLLELATRLSVLPSADTLLGRTARRGVLAMAEAIFEGNAHRDLRFSPFKNEVIGSYSYTLAEQSVLAGIPTGVSWFDVAVDRIVDALSQTTAISNSSVAAFDRPWDTTALDGRTVLVGPADVENFVQGPRAYGGGAQPQ